MPESATRIKNMPGSCKLEGNLLEYPLFYFGDRNLPKKKSYTFNENDGMLRKFTVLNAEGLPGAIAQDCLVALMMLREKIGAHQVNFFVKDVARLIFGRRRAERGHKQELVKRNLERLGTTVVKFKDSFYDKGGDQYVTTRGVALFPEWNLFERHRGKNHMEAWKENVFHLADLFERNIDAKYFNWIYFEKYRDLKSGLPRRLFLYLTKKSDGGRRREFSIHVEKLYPRLPITANRPSKRFEYLERAAKELAKIGIKHKYTKKGIVTFLFPAKFEKVANAPRIDRAAVDNLVVRFYKAIGTEKLSARRREDGIQVLAQIQAEAGIGVERLGEIVDWVLARREKKFKGLHSIKVLEKCWDQALSDIKRAEKRKATAKEKLAQARADEELGRKHDQDLAEARAALSEKERAEIRAEAERRLQNDRAFAFHLSRLVSIKDAKERERQRDQVLSAIEDAMIRERVATL